MLLPYFSKTQTSVSPQASQCRLHKRLLLDFASYQKKSQGLEELTDEDLDEIDIDRKEEEETVPVSILHFKALAKIMKLQWALIDKGWNAIP